MKKIIVALLMAIFVFALAACGTDKQGAPAENKEAEGKVNSETIAGAGTVAEDGDAPQKTSTSQIFRKKRWR